MTPRERQDEAVRLVSRMSYGAAARRLGVSRATVAGLVYRARHVKEDEAPRVKPARVQDDRWDERRLTERWADRKRKRDAAQAAR